MASMWTGLLFMHGHITNLDLVRSLDHDKQRGTPDARLVTGKTATKPKADSPDSCGNRLRPAC